jgi:hypothetical protein
MTETPIHRKLLTETEIRDLARFLIIEIAGSLGSDESIEQMLHRVRQKVNIQAGKIKKMWHREARIQPQEFVDLLCASEKVRDPSWAPSFSEYGSLDMPYAAMERMREHERMRREEASS